MCQDTSYVKYRVVINDSIAINPKVNEIKEINNDSIVDVGFDDTEFCIVFPGGEKALRKAVIKSIMYSPEMIKSNIEGKVYASFTVNENGKVENIKIEKSLSHEFDKEVFRVLSEMPDWKWNCKEKPRRKILIKRYFSISFGLSKEKK